MLKTAWRIVHALLTLTAVGCCVYLILRPAAPIPTGRASEDADYVLRRFLNVKWIGGDAELPVDVQHCVVVAFVYQDGKFDHWLTSEAFSPQGQSRLIPTMAMWGPTPKGVRGAVGGSIESADPIWEKLNFGLGRSFGSSYSGEVHGYRIIGFAYSQDCRPGHEHKKMIGGESPTEVVESRQHVLLLGYKPFASKEEAEHYVVGQGMMRDFAKSTN